MANRKLCFNNVADDATFSGSAASGYPATNLADDNVSKPWRSTGTTLPVKEFRMSLTAAASVEACALVNHNFSSGTKVRLRAGTAPLDLDFTTATTDSRLTVSGGANGTAVNGSGVLAAATTPRIDFDPASPNVLASRGVLIEAAATNSLLRSQEYDNAAWTAFGAVVTPNTRTAPDGTVSIDTITAGAASQSVLQDITAGGTTRRAASFIFEAGGTCNSVSLRILWRTGGVTENVLCTFNAITGAFIANGSTGATLVEAGVTALYGNFYRAYVVGTGTDALNTQVATQLLFNNTGTLFAWGSQNEATEVTSYIPTTTTALTRTADSITVTGADFTAAHSATAGTLYAEFSLTSVSGSRVVCALDDGTSNNTITLTTSGTSLLLTVVTGGALQANITIGTVAVGTVYKVAAAWSANDFAASLAGAAVVTDTAGTIPTVDRMRLGADAGGNYLTGRLKRAVRWTTRLANADLISLSTSGPGVYDYDSGWINVLQMTFTGTLPSDWGSVYDVIVPLTAAESVRYATVDIYDPVNYSSYVQVGRFFMGSATFQPTTDAIEIEDGWIDPSVIGRTPTRKKLSYELPKVRFAAMDFVVTEAEGHQLHDLVGQTGMTREVLYLPDPADSAECQRYGFVGTMEKLDPMRFPLIGIRQHAFQIEKKT